MKSIKMVSLKCSVAGYIMKLGQLGRAKKSWKLRHRGKVEPTVNPPSPVSPATLSYSYPPSPNLLFSLRSLYTLTLHMLKEPSPNALAVFLSHVFVCGCNLFQSNYNNTMVLLSASSLLLLLSNPEFSRQCHCDCWIKPPQCFLLFTF